MKTFLKNWKTTIFGILSGIIAGLVAHHTIDPVTGIVAGSIVNGIGNILAADGTSTQK